MKAYLLLYLFLTVQVLAQSKSLGTLDFPTSGSAEAQEHFIEGVLLLHSFEYETARRSFVQARELEPDFAMAYWGEAMTYNHPVWSRVYPEPAITALNRLAPTPEERQAKAPTQREKDYLAAVEHLFVDSDDKPERDRAYSEAMRILQETYPEDLEAATFYALSILGTAQAKRDFRIYMRAGAVASRAFEKNKNHPGAAHYVIHSFDDPIHAPLGLEAAYIYADIAPDAPHALHMPSHIFMAMGMWPESNATNERSADASEKHRGRPNLHAIWWLCYGYLQEGRFAEADRLVQSVKTMVENNGGTRRRDHLAYMNAAYIVETENWNHDAMADMEDQDDLHLGAAANLALARALAGYNKGQGSAVLSQILQSVDALDEGTAIYSDVEVRELISLQIKALHDISAGQTEDALANLKTATEMQEQMTFEFGPTAPVKPVYEQYGEVLLISGNHELAVDAFRKSLEREPRRLRSLLGLARAAAASENSELSQKTYQALKEMLVHADGNIAPLDEINDGAQHSMR